MPQLVDGIHDRSSFAVLDGKGSKFILDGGLIIQMQQIRAIHLLKR